MGIFDLFGKKDVAIDLRKQMPYNITTEFVPYKLRSNSRGSTVLTVNVRNMTQEPVMGSVVVQVPDRISLDTTGLAKEREVRLGTITPNENKEAKIELFGGVGTDKGEYTVTITAFIHYRDYAHVLNAMKKRATIEVV